MPPRKSKQEDKSHEDALPIDQSDEGKMKALEAALTDLTKRFGDGTIVRLGDATHMVVDVVPTGSLMVDIATGVGGVARGRITEIYGAESSGKTTLCLHIIAEAQKRGGICAFVDMEHALDPLYAGRIGVNMDTLYVSQPDTAEQALEIVEALVRSGALDVVVLDSVAALVPRVEIEGEMGDSHVGIQARLMSQALRKLSGAIKQSNVAVLFTNQLREKIGVMYGCARGDSPVMMADGNFEKISTLVDGRIDKPVLSYNVTTGAFEPSRILNWFNNGPANEFVKFTAVSVADNSIHTFTCTPNHQLLTEYGYESADEITINTHLIVKASSDEDDSEWVGTEMAITSIERVVLPSHEARYDLEIEGNHCYVVDNIVVHNSPETQPGGRALKFYASMRFDVRRIESLKQGSEIIGNRTKVRVTKNKVAPPFKEAEFDIMFTPAEAGISKMGELVDLGADLGIIEKRGAFYRYNDGLLGQGRENAKQFLGENPAIAVEIEEAIRAHYNLPSLLRG